MGLVNSLLIQLGCFDHKTAHPEQDWEQIQEQEQREIQRPSDSTQRDFRCDVHRRKTLKKCGQIEQKRVSLDPVLEYSASETKTEFEKKTESSQGRKSERERQKKRKTDDSEGMKRKSALEPLVVNAAPRKSASAPERSKTPRKRVKDSEQHMNALGQKKKAYQDASPLCSETVRLSLSPLPTPVAPETPAHEKIKSLQSSASEPKVIHVAPKYSAPAPEERRSVRTLCQDVEETNQGVAQHTPAAPEKSFQSPKPMVIYVAPICSASSPEMRRSKKGPKKRAKEQHTSNHEGSNKLLVKTAPFSPNPQNTQETKLMKAAKDSEQHFVLEQSGEKKMQTFIKTKQAVASQIPAHEKMKSLQSSASEPKVIHVAPKHSAPAPEERRLVRTLCQDVEEINRDVAPRTSAPGPEKTFQSPASKPKVIHVAPAPEERCLVRTLSLDVEEINREGSSELLVETAPFSPNTQETKLKKAAKDSEQHIVLEKSGEKKMKTFIKTKQAVVPRTSAPAPEEVKSLYSSVSELLVLDVAPKYSASAPEEQRETLQQTGQIKKQIHIQTKHKESNPLSVRSALLSSDVEYTEVITLSTTSSQSDLSPQLTDILMDIEYDDSGFVEDDDLQFISQSELKDNGHQRSLKAWMERYRTFCWMEKSVEMLETESESETDEVQLEAPEEQEAPDERASIETNTDKKHVFQKTIEEIDEKIMKMFQVRSNGPSGAAQPQVKVQEKINAVKKTKGLFVLYTLAEQRARKKEEKKRRKEKERRDHQLLLEKYTNSPAMKHLLINKHNRFNKSS